MLKNSITLGLGIIAAATSMVASAIHYSDDLPVKLGEWNSKFEEAMQIADEQHIPVVLFWGGASCTICKNVEAAMDDQEVLDWQARRKIVMVFQDGKEGPMKEFVRNPSSQLPYLCVYWNRGNGVATTNRFSGVVSGAARWPATGTTTAERFINSVELYIHEYQPDERHSGHFVCGDDPSNRLEASLGKTRVLYVPLTRDMVSAQFVTTNYLVSSYSEQVGLPTATNLVSWAFGESEKSVGLVIPDGGDFRAGDEMKLELLDSGKMFVEERHAKFVQEPENGPGNPTWIGQCTAEELKAGEWTMDLDVATNRTARQEGESWTLALLAGSLWCPDCWRVDNNFLVQPEFHEWATNRNVSLVAIDVPNIGSTRITASLLSHVQATASWEPKPVSGTPYLSRNMIPEGGPLGAAEIRARNAWLVSSNEAFHRPEDTNPNRTGVPIFVLLRKDGTIAGRFTRLASKSPTDATNVRQYLKRLDEMMEMAGDYTEPDNNHPSTTAIVLNSEERGNGRIFHADAQDVWRLPTTDVGTEVKVLASGERPVDVTLSIIGVDAETGVQNTIAAATGVLEGLEVKALVTTNMDLYAMISCDVGKTAEFAAECADSTIAAYSLAVSSVTVPAQRLQHATTAEGSVIVRLTEGSVYHFENLVEDEAFSNALKRVMDVDLPLYCSTTNADYVLHVEGGWLDHQVWIPGEIAFVSPEDMSLPETTGIVEIAVQRINGVSGESSVKVTVDDSAVTPGRYQIGLLDESGDFVECDPVLTWVDGELGAKSFALKVLDDFAHDGDQTLQLELAVAAGAAKIAEAGAKLKVTLLDDDHDGPGRLAITSVEPGAARGTTVYAFAGTNVLFDVSRYEAADGEVSATLAAKLDGETVPGLLSTTNLVWEDKCRGEAAVKRVKLAIPEDKVGSTVTVTLTATGAAPVDFARKTFTVKIVSPAVAKFESDGASWTALTRTYLEQSVAITGAGEGGKLSIRKLSGSLPGGVTVAYDAETGALTFVGTPNRAGAFTASYQVFEELNGVSTAGGTFIANFDVQAIGTVFPSLGTASGATSRTFRDIYFVEEESKRVAGVLTLTLASNGKLSAKYRCSAGSLALSTTGWGEWDPVAGTVKALLTNRKPDYSGYWAFVTQHADGAVEVEMHDNRFPAVYFVRTLTDRDIFGAGNTADAWRGQYTLAMPVIEYRPASDYDIAYTAAAAGDPVFKLRMSTKSAIRAGRFTWSGFLPNGKGVSGSAVVNADGTAALVPIFHRDSANLFSALVSVAGGMADDYAESKGGEFGFGLRAITAAKSALNWWEYTDSRTTTLSSAWTYDAYGSYLPDDLDLGDLLLKSGVTDEIVFTADMTKLPDSPTYGKSLGAVEVPVQVGAVELESASDEVKLRLDRKTGLVSGSVMLPFEDKTVRANFRGIVLPGWTGCGCHDEDKDLPLILGSTWFNDKVLYVDSATKAKRMLSVRRGCAVSGETLITE